MKRTIWLVIAVTVLLAGCASAKMPQAYIDVAGRSVVYMKADIATFQISAECIADTTDEARKGTDAIIGEAISVLKEKYSVSDENIETGYLSLSPYYVWIENERVLKGQRGAQSVNVTVSDISAVGNIVEDLSKINGISVSSISLDKKDKSAETEKARELAVRNALEKAETYAAAAGAKVGRVQVISDSGSDDVYTGSNRMYAMAAEATMDSASGTSFYAYNLSVSDTVYLTVELL